MLYLVKNKYGYYSFRARVPSSLRPFFNQTEIIKTLATRDYNVAKKKVIDLSIGFRNLVKIKKLNMLDNTAIEKLVNEYIQERLEKDFNARLQLISLKKLEKKPKLKDPLRVELLLKEYKQDLSDFDVSRVKMLADSFAEEVGEQFDIENLNHKKLALSLLRANIKVFETILARNKGEWGYDEILSYKTIKEKEIPSIEESIKDYLEFYENTTNAQTADQRRDTKNFFNDVALHLLRYFIDSLDELDDSIIFEIKTMIPKLFRRTGRVQQSSIWEFLINNKFESNDYQTISRETANKHIKKMRAYLKYLSDKHITNQNFSESLTMYPTESALTQRNHLDSDEIKVLIAKAGEYHYFLEIIVKIFAYSGMRLSELFKCELKEEEIKGKGNIKYFDLTNTEIRLKTTTSHRKIPLHSELHFLTKNQFQELQNQYKTSDFISKKVNELINEYISEEPTKVLYSLRHSFATYLKQKGIEESIVAELMGHSRGTTLSYTRYAGAFPLITLKEYIDKLEYN